MPYGNEEMPSTETQPPGEKEQEQTEGERSLGSEAPLHPPEDHYGTGEEVGGTCRSIAPGKPGGNPFLRAL